MSELNDKLIVLMHPELETIIKIFPGAELMPPEKDKKNAKNLQKKLQSEA